MAVRQLNFEVFEEIYHHCAYDSVAFGCFFSCLSDYILGQPLQPRTDFLIGNHSSISSLSQAEETSQQRCVLEEVQEHQGTDDQMQAEDDDGDVEVLQSKPDDCPRRRRRAVAPVDTSLLRRSARLEKINKGFNPNGGSLSASPASTAPSSSKPKDKKKGKERVLDGPAYSVHSIPGAPPAPYLSLANVQSIGVGSCRMQPGVVSGSVLQAPINEDVDK
jgi:hypothetical protein